MSDGLIVLRYLKVENANAISGVTWGFPSITNFLGFVHAVSRKISRKYELTLSGCAVVSHGQQVQVHRSKKYGEYLFATTRNPLTKDNETPPFNQEGRMHMTVSLAMPFSGRLPNGTDEQRQFKEHLAGIIYGCRLAGGTITNINEVIAKRYPENEEDLQKFERCILKILRPGFALISRRELLEMHFNDLRKENPTLDRLDAILDFISLKHHSLKPVSTLEEDSKVDGVEWKMVPKPHRGWVVPIQTGYQGISELYQPGVVKNTRDSSVSFRFAEAAYTLGEWISPHRASTVDDLVWQYNVDADNGLYLCENKFK